MKLGWSTQKHAGLRMTPGFEISNLQFEMALAGSKRLGPYELDLSALTVIEGVKRGGEL